MMDDFKGVYIEEEDITKYLYMRLIDMGYVPSTDEILDISEIMFDFLLEKSLIEDDLDE